jgi:hypothetical protein
VMGGAISAIASLMPWSTFDSMLFTMYAVSGVGLGYGFLTLLAEIGLVAVGTRALVPTTRPSLSWVACRPCGRWQLRSPSSRAIDLDFRGNQGPLFEHPAGLTLGIYIVEIGGLVATPGCSRLTRELPARSPGTQAPPEAA